MHIKQFNIENKKLYDLAFEIRKTAFIDELNIDAELELEYEEESVFYLLFSDNNKPIATARYRPTILGFKIERVAVVKLERNKGYGKFILEKILTDLKPFNQTIYLNAQMEAVNFYLRNGFDIEGPAFLDAGLVHYKMVFKSQS